jgi:hypothetical protein
VTGEAFFLTQIYFQRLGGCHTCALANQWHWRLAEDGDLLARGCVGAVAGIEAISDVFFMMVKRVALAACLMVFILAGVVPPLVNLTVVVVGLWVISGIERPADFTLVHHRERNATQERKSDPDTPANSPDI